MGRSFRQGSKADAAPVEIENDLHGIKHQPAEPVELPNHRHATRFQSCQGHLLRL
jgi:hypothetical protein